MEQSHKVLIKSYDSVKTLKPILLEFNDSLLAILTNSLHPSLQRSFDSLSFHAAKLYRDLAPGQDENLIHIFKTTPISMSPGTFDIDHVLTFYSMYLDKNEGISSLSFTKAQEEFQALYNNTIIFINQLRIFVNQEYLIILI